MAAAKFSKSNSGSARKAFKKLARPKARSKSLIQILAWQLQTRQRRFQKIRSSRELDQGVHFSRRFTPVPKKRVQEEQILEIYVWLNLTIR